MQRKSFDNMRCPIARSLERVGEWWSILILRDAFHGLTRFDQFQKSLGIAPNMLTRRLNAAHWLKQLPLQTVYLLTPRPSMPTGGHVLRCERGEIDERTGEPCRVGGGKQDFCWLVFNRGYRGEAVLRWLQPETNARMGEICLPPAPPAPPPPPALQQ